MTNVNLREQIATLKSKNRIKESIVKKHFPTLYTDVLNRTSYMQDARFNERVFHILNDMWKRPLCPTCGVMPCEWFYDYFRYKQCCSHECFLRCPVRFEKIKGTLNERYDSNSAFGDKTVRQKASDTVKARYGVDSVMQDENIKKRQRLSNKQSTGFENNFLNPSIVQSIKANNITKYGVENVFSSGWKRDEMKRSMLEKYGYDNPKKGLIPSASRKLLEDKDWLTEMISTLGLPLYHIAEMLDCDPTTVSNWARRFEIPLTKQNESFIERKLHDAIVEGGYTGKIVRHDRGVIVPLELDFVFPEANVAIEVCGNYWHSEKFKDIGYHRDKFKKCADAGYSLLTIYEDEINDRFDAVVKTVLHKLGCLNEKRVYARKTHIVEVSKNHKKKFLDLYHIQGNDKGSVAYGLMLKDELVAVMSLQILKTEIIISRFATKYLVSGGFSKLLKSVCDAYPNTTISTFADLRWSVGKLYHDNGFTVSKHVPVSYDYVKKDKRYHKFNLRKKFMINNFGVDPSLTEHEMAKSAGFLRIYDCGKLKFTKTKGLK